MEKCDICGRAGSDVAAHKSTLGPKKVNYCMECLYGGREPYNDLVEFGWDYSMFNSTYQKKIILPTLAFYNKTIQQFNEDIKKKRDEINVTLST